MTFYQNIDLFISPVFTTIACSLLLVFANGLKRPRTEMSIFPEARSHKEMGRTILVHSFNRAKPRHYNSAIELRPRWGFSVFAPLSVYLIFTSTYWDQFWGFIGMYDTVFITLFTTGLLLLVAYFWIWQTFFHKVTYDADSITVSDDVFRTKTCDLAGLEGIEPHRILPLYRLFFEDGTILEVASNISHRANFLADMDAKIVENKTGTRCNLNMIKQEIFTPGMQAPTFHAKPTFVPDNPMAAKDVDTLPPELARF